LQEDGKEMLGRWLVDHGLMADKWQGDTGRWQADATGGFPMACRRLVVIKHIAGIRQVDSSKGHAGTWRDVEEESSSKMSDNRLTDS
jgi:hypothetical protein